MPEHVVVIGGGLAGLQSAYFLNREGIRVTLVERNDGCARETSFANGGLITPSHAAPWNSPGVWRVLLSSIGNEKSSIYVRALSLPQYAGWGLKFLRNSTPARFHQTIRRNGRLALYSVEHFNELCTDIDLTFDRGQHGTLMVYRNQASFDRAKTANDVMASAGVEIEMCTPYELAGHEPALNDVADSLVGGFYYESDQHGDAHLFSTQLADHLADAGVTLRLGETVTGFATNGSAIKAVQTDRDEIKADAVVLAAAQWSGALARGIGLRLPLQPVKGYSVTHDASGWNNAPKIPVVDDELHIGVTPMGSRVRFVGTAEFSGHSQDVNPRRIENLWRAARQTFPGVQSVIDAGPPLLKWCCHRPMTPDCLPLIGQHGPDNLYLNTGHGYLGWTTATGTSRAVTDQIVGRPVAISLGDYGLDRF